MSIAWQKVYGDDAEERIWDGRGLSANDVKPEHIKAEPERDEEEGSRLAERDAYIGTWSNQDVTKRLPGAEWEAQLEAG